MRSPPRSIRRHAFATFTAIAAVGTLAVVLATVAVLFQTEAKRTQAAIQQAQARQLLIAAMAAEGESVELPPELTADPDTLRVELTDAGQTMIQAHVGDTTLQTIFDPNAEVDLRPLELSIFATPQAPRGHR